MTTTTEPRTSTGPERRERPAGNVPEAFDAVASTYDLMVALNPGYHAHLRASADDLVAALPTTVTSGGRPVRVADLGCGSGASTAALQAALEAAGVDAELVGVDGSAGMLAQARRKRWSLPARFVQADAETVEVTDLDGPYDAVFAAYLFRNVAARDRLLGRVHDLLVPGGVLVVHEYSVRESRRARATWDAVCWGVVVPLGLVTAPRSPIYRYLWRSVRDFDSTLVMRSRMVAAGLDRVRSRTVGGWQNGVLHTFLGHRPEDR